MNNENKQSCGVNRKHDWGSGAADSGSGAALSPALSLPHSSRASFILAPDSAPEPQHLRNPRTFRKLPPGRGEQATTVNGVALWKHHNTSKQATPLCIKCSENLE